VKIKVKKRKQEYVKITRKLRGYLKELKKQEKISKEEEKDLRKKIRNRKFNSLSSLKAYLKVSGGTKQNENTKTKKKRK
jgi:ribosomal protein L19E